MTKPARVASNGRDARVGSLVLDGEPAHRGEAGEDQRHDAGLGAAGEHRVGCAALDHLGGLADGVRAGCAGGDDCVVRALDAERDRELSGDGVDEHVRQEVRGDAVRPALAQRVGLLEDAGDAADRRAEHDPDAGRVEAVQPGVRQRLAAGGDAEEHVALELPASFAETTCVGSKSFTWPAIRTGSPSVSKVEIQSMPLSPASAARQVPGASSPSGVTAPMPVTATRLIEQA